MVNYIMANIPMGESSLHRNIMPINIMLYHSGGKPHICGTCEKSSTEKSTLSDHIAIDTAEKPHSSGSVWGRSANR